MDDRCPTSYGVLLIAAVMGVAAVGVVVVAAIWIVRTVT